MMRPLEITKRNEMMMDSSSIRRAIKSLLRWTAVAPLGAGMALAAQSAPQISSATVSGLPARNIGSATMSGRIAAVAGVTQDGRVTLFVGSASGGVWKSVNGGTTFKPVFDRQDVQSIGAVAIDPSRRS